jgi:IS605 OrfB family transposase
MSSSTQNGIEPCHSTVELNPGKLKELAALIRAFNDERGFWVNELKGLDKLALLDGPGLRKLRDEYVKAKYVSPSGLQARGWKLALTEAAALLDRHWQAQLVTIKEAIGKRRELEDDERHLLYYALKSYGMISDMLNQNEPASVTKKFEELVPDVKKRTNLLRWLRRRIRAMLRDNRLPVVKAERSAVFDANCYDVFMEKSTWYVRIASLTPRKRIAIPLNGAGDGIDGNICLTLDGNHVEIHTMHKLPSPIFAPKKAALKGKPFKTNHTAVVAVDAGFTEVCVSNDGTVYGAGFGKLMSCAAKARNTKGQRRNRLYSIAEKARERGDEGKARRVEANNLGTVKQEQLLVKTQASIQVHINKAVNALLAPRPAAVVHEDLSHAKFKFQYGAASNRSLSAWARGQYQERLDFKAQVRGSRLIAVNPAYSSQLCPICGFVDKENRTGDRFLCLHCKHSGAADQVAALNLLARASDSEIQCWMSPSQVKTILQERFKRRLEASEAAKAAGVVTVAGKTSDVVSVATHTPRGSKKPHSGESRKVARLNPSTTRRANNRKPKPINPPTLR